MGMLASAAPYMPTLFAGASTVKALRDKPKMPPPIPMPDEEMIRKSARRMSGTRRGGRASTILTGTEDGLGG